MRATSQLPVKVYFLTSFILVLIDATLLTVSGYYRTRLGNQESLFDYSFLILPPSILLLFYGATCHKLFRGKSLGRKVLIAQCVFFSFTALMMLIPFGGYFFAPFNPMSVVYFTSMDWWPFPDGWYYSLCGMSFLFILATVAVTVAAIRNQKRLAGLR